MLELKEFQTPRNHKDGDGQGGSCCFFLLEKVVLEKTHARKTPAKKNRWKCLSIFVPRSCLQFQGCNFRLHDWFFGAPLTDNKNKLHQQESSRKTLQQSQKYVFWDFVDVCWASPGLNAELYNFSPRKLGKMNPFLTNIFQMFWNHQLDINLFSIHKLPQVLMQK